MNANVNSTSSRLLLLMLATVLTFVFALAQAAPGPLSDTPLFLGHQAQPNILLMMDNSGSMDEEVLLSKGAVGLYPITGGHKLWFDSSKTKQTWGQIHSNLSHCVGFNVLAYDPGKDYTPWYGKDTNNNAFRDQSVTAAAVNPYTGTGEGNGCSSSDSSVNNSNGYTCNLTNGFTLGEGAFYYVWDDRNNNGLYDKGECSSDEHKADDYNADDRVYIRDLDSDKQTNYANWFSYYRKRDYVMKRAVSQIIAESSNRLGLAVINNDYVNHHLTDDNKFVGTPIKNVDDISIPVNTTAHANKTTLMDNLLGIKPSGPTPLRKGLERVGAYFRNMDDGTLFGSTISDDPDSASGHSPILKANLGGACQQNFVVLLSDGYWNGDNPNVGDADADTTNEFDGQSYADSIVVDVADADADANADAVADATGSISNTLADVAMSLYKGDLLDTLNNEVYPVAIPRGSDPAVECYDAVGNKTQECFDTNNAQHLVTFIVSFGVEGSIPIYAAGGKSECIPGNRTESVTEQKWPSSCQSDLPIEERVANGWPVPVVDTATTVDDMKHAAWNGRGRYLAASDPDGLISKLNQAISDINERKPVSAAAVSVNTFNVIDGGHLYQGRFDSANWSGQLTARTITGSIVGDSVWEAHTLLASMSINDRVLVTHSGAANTTGIEFSFPADYRTLGANDLSQAQVNDLLHNAPFDIESNDTVEIAANQAYGESLVDYIRGDTSNEGANSSDFRERAGQRLGDIIHSSPVYVGNPNPDRYPDSIAADSYQAWANNLVTASQDPGAKGRQEMIYVGANDGALHAFFAAGVAAGKEVFAYYPKAIFSDEEKLGLHWLADPAYEHRFYVDMEPAVGEVYVNTGDSDGLTWRTLLVGGLRGGGRAVYAIDVSKPAEFSTPSGVAGNILWEFTHADLGYTYSKPTIVKLNDGRWAAIFGNGYNPTGATATGEAVLFIKYLDTAIPSHREIYTKVGSIHNGDCQNALSNCNGLSTPAVVDLGADRVADRVYAGDLQGNLWVFDLSSSDGDDWTSAYGTSSEPLPLFKARSLDDTGAQHPQPITTKPIVTRHPTKRQDATRPNNMVFFGTGQYMVENDLSNTGSNSFYGIWDSGVPISLDRSGSTDPVLVEQTITQDSTGTAVVRKLTHNSVNYTTQKGWFVDLPTSGERVVVHPIVLGELVTYTTMVPFSNLCGDSAGYSWLMVHNLEDGSEPAYVALDVTGNDVFDGDDRIDGHNVAGIKSEGIYWQPTLIKSGSGMGTLLLPSDREVLDHENIPLRPKRDTRSSWGLLHYED